MTVSPIPAELSALMQRGIDAYKRNDAASAFELFAEALQRWPYYDKAWLWLAAVVKRSAERRFCFEHILYLDPANVQARQGLSTLPATEAAASPLPQLTADLLPRCGVGGCIEAVARQGHRFCYRHWSEQQAQPQAGAHLAPAALGEQLNLSGHQVEQLLGELGWQRRDDHGWRATSQGEAQGGIQRQHPKSGVAFVVWPAAILQHPGVHQSAAALRGERSTQPQHAIEAAYREQHPASLLTADGHRVRSRAELAIDNWLYMAGLVHGYERLLPIEAEAYGAFYIPSGNVFLEYWEEQGNPTKRERDRYKQALYQQHQIPVVALNAEQIEHLNDALPRLLIHHGIDVE